MKPKAVAYTLAAGFLMAGCSATDSTGTKQMAAPSKVNPEAIVYLTNERDVPYSNTDSNPCTGESVNITANSHFVIMTGFDSNGGLHYSANIVTKGSGVSATKTFVINEHFHYVEQTPGLQQGYVIIQRGTIKVDGPKTTDDYYTVVTFKTVVDANGNPTAGVESTYTSCTAP